MARSRLRRAPWSTRYRAAAGIACGRVVGAAVAVAGPGVAGLAARHTADLHRPTGPGPVAPRAHPGEPGPAVVGLDLADGRQHRPGDPVAGAGLAVQAQVAGGDVGGRGPARPGLAGGRLGGRGRLGRWLDQAQVLGHAVGGDGQHEQAGQDHRAAQPERGQEPEGERQQPGGEDHRCLRPPNRARASSQAASPRQAPARAPACSAAVNCSQPRKSRKRRRSSAGPWSDGPQLADGGCWWSGPGCRGPGPRPSDLGRPPSPHAAATGRGCGR